MWMSVVAKGLTTTILALVVGALSLALHRYGYFGSSARTGVVQMSGGQKVQGVIGVSRDGREYASYLGIPYAEPPVGDFRFEPPVPLRSAWVGVKDADAYSPDCYQFDAMVKGRFMGSEDCLYLNVFSPNLSPKERQQVDKKGLPVMVWIHGGGFLSGGAKMYDPKYFMDFNVTVVTINYRLGPLGFLNTGDDSVRGNMGLKDQTLALRWVKDHIANFGGNPDRITIFGESAGAASVHAHILSPQSKGLFHKAIMQSGSMASPWSFKSDLTAQAEAYLKLVGCALGNKEKVTVCLKSKSVRDLTTPVVQFMQQSPFAPIEYASAPSIEPYSKEEDAFFGKSPKVLLESGDYDHIPVMMGVTSGEGGLRTARLEAGDVSLETLDKDWNKKYCPLLNFYDPSRVEVSEKIKEQYFTKGKFAAMDRHSFLANFTQMMSDSWFFYGIQQAANFHLNLKSKQNKTPVYLYFYDYQASSVPGSYSLMKAVRTDDWLPAELKVAWSIFKDLFVAYFGFHGHHEYGACHADDLFQLFKVDLFEIGRKSRDYQFSKSFVKAFVDFASNDERLDFDGEEWPRNIGHSKQLQYMKISSQKAVIEEPFKENLKFWKSLGIR